jgi:hypothetical protein
MRQEYSLKRSSLYAIPGSSLAHVGGSFACPSPHWFHNHFHNSSDVQIEKGLQAGKSALVAGK